MRTKFFQFFLDLTFLVSCSTSTSPKQEQLLNYQVVENARLIEDTLAYKIDYQFPWFESEKEELSSQLSKLNDKIKYFLDVAQHTFWGVDAEGAIKIVQESESSGKYELMNRYEILDTTNCLISLKFETYSFALGAHGFTALNTYNLDLETGRLLKLVDIVDISDANNLMQFNQLLVASFVNTEDCFTEDPKIDIKYDLFAISPDFLVIYFEAYELGPYYCGAAEILVSIDELKEVGLWKMVDF